MLWNLLTCLTHSPTISASCKNNTFLTWYQKWDERCSSDLVWFETVFLFVEFCNSFVASSSLANSPIMNRFLAPSHSISTMKEEMERGIKTILTGNGIRFEIQKSPKSHFTNFYKKGSFFTFNIENDED